MFLIKPTSVVLLLLSISSSHAFNCSVSSCSFFGARATCCPSAPCLPMACAVWHTRNAPAICRFPCPSACFPPSLRPIATDAIAYCNNCTLSRASCNYGFDIHGPIDRGLALAVDAEPTTIQIPTPEPSSPPLSPSPDPSPDSFFHFDFPNSSPSFAELTAEPSSGPEETPFMDATPLPIILPECSIEFCTQFGAKAECSSPSYQSTTCLEWSAQTAEGGCPIVCTSRCNVGLSAPLASDGRRYCSLCHLRLISCLTAYMVTGPVPIHDNPNVTQQTPTQRPVQVLF